VKRKILTCIVLAVFLCGCIGGFHTAEQSVVQPTVGQELIDLKKALDNVAVTEKEYSELKQKIMNRDE